MVKVRERAVELVSEVRAPRARTAFVVWPVHDVVGEQLRAAVKQLRQRPLAVLGVELVLLLHRNPGELTTLLGHLLTKFRVLGLELRKLVASSLPFLARSGLLVGHALPP